MSIDAGPIDVDEAQHVCRLCGAEAIYWPGFCSPCYPEWRNRADWEVSGDD